jgi:hypothetical protein
VKDSSRLITNIKKTIKIEFDNAFIIEIIIYQRFSAGYQRNRLVYQRFLDFISGNSTFISESKINHSLEGTFQNYK